MPWAGPPGPAPAHLQCTTATDTPLWPEACPRCVSADQGAGVGVTAAAAVLRKLQRTACRSRQGPQARAWRSSEALSGLSILIPAPTQCTHPRSTQHTPAGSTHPTHPGSTQLTLPAGSTHPIPLTSAPQKTGRTACCSVGCARTAGGLVPARDAARRSGLGPGLHTPGSSPYQVLLAPVLSCLLSPAACLPWQSRQPRLLTTAGQRACKARLLSTAGQ